MKKFLSFCGAAIAALFLCPNVQSAAGGQIAADTTLIPGGAVAYSSTWSMRTDGLNWASAVTVLSSTTLTAVNFTDGSPSTGSITISNFATLSTAAAAGYLSISSDTQLAGACISGGGPGLGSFNVCNPANFAVDLNYSSNTALNIAAAINTFNIVIASVPGSTSVIYTSAPVGNAGNSFQISVSTWGAIPFSNLASSTPFQVGYATMTGGGYGFLKGGQDNQFVLVNGQKFLANTQTGFYPMTSNTQTATNLGTAINNSSGTLGVMAVGGGTVVSASSTVINQTFTMFSSSQNAMTLSSPTLVVTQPSASFTSTGASPPMYAIGTPNITIPGNGFAQGLGVYITTGSAVGLNYSTCTVGAPTNILQWGTTFYVVDIPPLGPGSVFGLATTQANAAANIPICIISSQTVATIQSDSFTVTPGNAGAISGTISQKWVVSNDQVNWTPFTTSAFGVALTNPSVTYNAVFSSTGTATYTDFGHVDYGWLGLSVVGPTVGQVNLNARVIGKQN